MAFKLGPLPYVPPGTFSQYGSPQALQQAEANTPNPSTPTPSNSQPAQSTGAQSSNPLTVLENAATSLADSTTKLTHMLGAFSAPQAPILYSPNELFDPLYWQVLFDNSVMMKGPQDTLINTLVGVADTTIVAEIERDLAVKYGPGGPDNYKTLLEKFGIYIFFGIIFIVLIGAFVNGKED